MSRRTGDLLGWACGGALLLGLAGPAFAQTELVRNGGFESGASGWSTRGDFHVGAWYARPHGGSGYAYLTTRDGDPGNLLAGALAQELTIPASASSVTLTFWYSVTTEEVGDEPFDVLDVLVLDPGGEVLAEVASLSNLDATPGGGYVRKDVDLTGHAGRTVRLELRGRTDERRPTVFRVDDVAVRAVAPTIAAGADAAGADAAGADAAGAEATATPAVARDRPEPFSQTDLLRNGGFESGAEGWSRQGAFHADARFARPRDGSGYAYLSQDDGDPGDRLSGSLAQELSIPASASSVTLTFWYSVTTEEVGDEAFDVLDVLVLDPGGEVLAEVASLSNLDATPGGSYVRRDVDLTPYAGRTVRLELRGRTDERRPTVFRVDDVAVVAVEVAEPAVAEATVAEAETPEPAAPPPAEEAVREARRLLAEERFAEAEARLADVLRSDPDHPAALRTRAELYRHTDRVDDARRDYRRLADLRPESADAWFWLATIDRWRGRSEESLAGYGRALALDGCHRDALEGRARLHRRMGDLDGAEADLRAALACRPDDETARELLADVLAARGALAEARELVGEVSTDGAEREKRLGNLEMAGARYAEAARHYRRALEIEPEDPSVLKRLGDAERLQGNGEAALAAYERSAALDPGNRDTLFWVGNMAYRNGEADKALEVFDALLETDPESAEALAGKARVLRVTGRPGEALELVDQALAAAPTNGDYLVLRASLLTSLGRPEEARLAYRTAVTEKPDNLEAQIGLERLGARRSWDTSGRYSSSVLIEGLEDAGLVVDGRVIRPTRIEYLGEGGVTGVESRLGDGLDLVATLSRFRQAIFNLDRNAAIYDFDVWTGLVGLERRLSEKWRLSWALGGTRYESRDRASIADETRERGEAELVRDDGRSRLRLAFSRAPFIQRGFAGDFDFRIFDRNHFSLGWDRRLSRRLTFEARGAVSTFDDGDEPVFARLALVWRRGGDLVSLSVRQDPFPARFLGPGQRLDFIDYEAASLRARAELGGGFRVSGEALRGRFEETRRQAVVDGRIVEGPLDENVRQLLVGRLEWSPPRQSILTLGVEYFHDEYDFDTGVYNNLDRDNWTPFVVLSSPSADRVRYLLRYGRGFLDDERDPDYSSDELEADLEFRLGGAAYRDQSYWLGLEARYGENDLDEKRERYRVYLRVPF